MRRHPVHAALTSLGGTLALALVVTMATGRLSFVVTHGISMEPSFHTGDLAVLWATGSYHVGQVVAYSSAELHTIVLHRIHAVHDGLFSFKGDHNDFVDPGLSPPSAIRGALILHVPRVGIVYTWMRAPLHALLAGLLVVVLAGTAAFEHRSVRRRGGPRLIGPVPAPPGSARSRHPRGTRSLLGGALAFAVFGVVLATGAITSGQRVSSLTQPYTERLTFSYSATADKSATYPTGTVSSGSPLFLKLVKSLEVHTSYRLSSPAPTSASGTIELQASVGEADGWSHVLVSSGPLHFDGPAASATLTLPIARALHLAQVASSETGLAYGPETISVTPTVSVRGTVAGRPFTSHLSGPQEFGMNALELNLQSDVPGSPAVGEPVTTRSGSVQTEVVSPGGLEVFGLRIGGGPLVGAGALGMALALALGLSGAARLWRTRDHSEEARTRRRLHRDLVPIDNDPSASARVVVDVSSVAALASLVDRFDVVVLDHLDHGEHVYFAAVNDILYRHRHAQPTCSDTLEGDVVPLFNAAASGWG